MKENNNQIWWHLVFWTNNYCTWINKDFSLLYHFEKYNITAIIIHTFLSFLSFSCLLMWINNCGFKTIYVHSGMPIGSTNGHAWHTGNHCLIQAGRLPYVSQLMCITHTCYTRCIETKATIWSLNEDFDNTGRKHYEIVVVIIIVLCFQLSAYWSV